MLREKPIVETYRIKEFVSEFYVFWHRHQQGNLRFLNNINWLNKKKDFREALKSDSDWLQDLRKDIDDDELSKVE